ncbi:RNA binding domain-containing protein painting of fourth isoform X1 [Megalopta genalis]|uniref:RNA binding domain-containing protein painting of fourth isoform X1 n=1 Tax=Megalopta genalis TaxID=115081 RepID=UPI003FD50EC5
MSQLLIFQVTDENGEAKRSFVKQECVTFGYDGTYTAYTTSSSSPSTVTQPLPGQPPLPPMPPPSGGVPPPPHVFGPVPSQVTPIPAWTHPPAPWQWISPQTSHLPPPPPRDIVANTFQREMPLRGNYMRRERFNNNRNNPYVQRNNYHRKNRRLARFGQSQGQFEQAAYFGTTLSSSLGLEWQRNNYATTASNAIINHIPPPNLPLPSIPPGILTNRHGEDTSDQEEVVVKKNKQRKPMSQSYPSRPWNREDAERALTIENEYNKQVRAQSLIIKFPDPDLNKDIVREFHPGIRNIHFQSPSGPRYCFIQMEESVDIDEAIKELETIPFGVGHLKVERKTLRDEDEPMPEEIDPYTLYIGNLPESVNVNEVKNKFPTAARVDVGFAQKMRNTRYAFMRYNSVDDSISAYKQAHNLMWDTRSIIVRFRRQRGNTCLPGEPKPNVKKVKEEPNSNAQVKNEQKANHADKSVTILGNNIGNRIQESSNQTQNKVTSQVPEQNTNLQTSTSPSSVPTSIASAKSAQLQQQQPWTSQPPQIPPASEAPPPCPEERESVTETIILTEIKKEPEDYEEMDMSSHIRSYKDIDDDVDDDDDDDEEEEEDDDSDDDEDNEGGYEEDEEENMDANGRLSFTDKQEEMMKDSESTDHLDQMFSELENMMA